MSPIVQPQALRTVSQQNQKRVRFDDSLNVRRTYQASQQELEPNSTSDSDDSDDDAPPTPPAPIVDDTSYLRQSPDQHGTSSEAAMMKPSQPDEAQDVHFGFSFEAKKDQEVDSPAMSDNFESRENASDDSQAVDTTSAAGIDQSAKIQTIQPTEVDEALASGCKALSAEESTDQIAGDCSGYDRVEAQLGDQLQGQNSSPVEELDASSELEEAPEAEMETRHLTDLAEDDQDVLQQGTRKSQRQKFRPLAYHLGERVHYQRDAAVRTLQTIVAALLLLDKSS